MTKRQHGLAMIFLTLFVAGCTTTTPPVVKTETVVQTPPKPLYPDCSEPNVTLKDNGDLARGFDLMRSKLAECRAGVEAIRSWSKQAGGNQ